MCGVSDTVKIVGISEKFSGSCLWGIKFPILCLLHCVPLYVCRLCINFQDQCASLLGDTSHVSR